MRLFLSFIFVTISLILYPIGGYAQAQSYDVVVVGGGVAGTAASIQSARMGCSTLLLAEDEWLGGMLTSAGVSAVDGNYKLQSGIFGEFRDALVSHYGGDKSLATGWVSSTLFEPSVGNEILHEIVTAEPLVTLWHNSKVLTISSIPTSGYRLVVQTTEGQREIKANILVDATELGDVSRVLGVPYDIGMESRADTQEDIAPIEGNCIIQDLTYVAILKEYDHPVVIPKPIDYDPAEFACSCKNVHCQTPVNPKRILWSPEDMLKYGRLPNGKYMINWPIEGNDYYVSAVEMSDEEREVAYQKAKEKTLRFLYFMQTELGFSSFGLDYDEFPTDDGFPLIPYHRESRRIHGVVRFDLNHLEHPYEQSQPLYRTAIAVGDYPVDHHHEAYHGDEFLPDLHFHSIPSFSVPLGVMIPRTRTDLIVTEKSVSVSNIVNGTTRLQPVVMQLGQAAGALAALAVQERKALAEVSVRALQQELLSGGGYLMPYLDVPKSDPLFLPLQRIGVTGILRGEGRTVDWSNETWFRKDDMLRYGEIYDLEQYYPQQAAQIREWRGDPDQEVTYKEVVRLLSLLSGTTITSVADLDISYSGEEEMITRGAFAYFLDLILDPFRKEVDIYGNLLM
ncbi:MAG: FAD-dependent oxidoreductase [Porphyromonas sp.]|nr:FAD-dependent oxidoreductase [Porphyromonas sp.]